MRRFCVAFILVALACSVAFTDGPTYIPLVQLAQKYNLRHEKDPLTGREVFSGKDQNIVASNGMSSIIVNNKLAILDNTLKLVNGKLSIAKGDYSRVELLFKEPQKAESIKQGRGIIKKVVIDAGHGGDFRGCKSKNGLLEKDVNLDIAKRLRNLLEDSGVKVAMTRTTDRSLSFNLNEDLKRRADFANREHPDLFVSIHCNWSNDPSVKGFEIYYCPEHGYQPALDEQTLNQRKPNDRQTQNALLHLLKDEYERRTLEVANKIKKEFNELPTEDRGIRRANFKVLKYSDCPALLVELDFLSNKRISQNMHNDSYRDKIAEKLKSAILSDGK